MTFEKDACNPDPAAADPEKKGLSHLQRKNMER
jgi:hypothetical protein